MTHLKIPVIPLGWPSGGIEGFYIRKFDRYRILRTVAGSGACPSGVPHRHAHFEVFWITAGSGRVMADFEQFSVGPGTLLLMSPGAVHSWIQTRKMAGTLVGFSRGFTPGFDAITGPGLRRAVRVDSDQAAALDRLMGEILEESRSPDPGRADVVKSLLGVLSHKIRRLCAPGASPRQESPLTRRFRAALDTDIPRLASVKQFAHQLGVSRSLLHRVVAADSGRAPSDWIHERLLLEAQRRLRHSGASVSEIARQLGFADASYFSRFFRRQCGVSPQAFRASGSVLASAPPTHGPTD